VFLPGYLDPVRAVVLYLAAVVGFLLTTTAMRTMEVLVGPPTALATGTASVLSCVEHGLIGLWGLGTSHGCTANVRWDDGRVERLDLVPGQLRPGDTAGTATPRNGVAIRQPHGDRRRRAGR
jgi:uncharacterized protein DUF6346